MNRLAILCALLVSFCGCAAIFNSSSKSVIFTSDPNGAEVLINGQPYGHTPLSLSLRQQETYAITFRAQGHDERTYRLNNSVGAGWIILDILGGLFPVVIDAATGSWYSLNDSAVHGVLPGPRIPVPTDSVSLSRATPAIQSQYPAVTPSSTIMPKIEGAPLTIGLDNGTVLAAILIEPWSMGSHRITLTTGQKIYANGGDIRSVLSADGVDWTKQAVEERKRIPRD